MVVSIRMTQEEKELANAYAKLSGVSLSEAIKRAFFDKIEEEYDIALANDATKEIERDSTTHSIDEVKKMFDL